ncbi:MAG: rod shape-determining protein [Bacilli bacterium]|nr:rod shape-determining protein [Bacilli bacterium]
MIYASIDIGSDSTKIVVVRYDKDDKSFDVIASTSVRTVGVKKGIITDKAMTKKSISLGISEIEKQIGFKIDKAIISLPCYDLEVTIHNGIVYTDGIVEGHDIITCFKNTIKDNISDDREVITVFPIDFTVDDEDKYADPKGVNGYKLETRLLISTLPKELVYSYLDLFNDCGIEVLDLSIGPVSDYYQARQEDFNIRLGAVVNIGDSKTEVSVFNKGLLVKATTLPIGSKAIDHDIKYIYGFDRTTSRSLKEGLAFATSSYANENERVEYESLSGEKKTISQLELSQIVEARLDEILKNVKKSLKTLTNREISYIIVTGGISNIPGFNYLLENIFGDITYMVNMNSMGVRSNIYSTCYGSVKYYYDKLELRGINETMYDEKKIDRDGNGYSNMIDKMQSFMDNN